MRKNEYTLGIYLYVDCKNMNQTIELQEKTVKNFSKSQLEKFINGNDFEDMVLAYQMLQWQTGITQSYADFKKSAWL